jgi:hypothetical protein
MQYITSESRSVDLSGWLVVYRLTSQSFQSLIMVERRSRADGQIPLTGMIHMRYR